MEDAYAGIEFEPRSTPITDEDINIVNVAGSSISFLARQGAMCYGGHPSHRQQWSDSHDDFQATPRVLQQA
jgi:hypothetical protein